MNNLPYRQNVCILLCNKKRQLFIGERCNYPEHWQFPQGGVEPDASLEENALRETEEETGIPRAYLRILKQLRSTYRYDFREVPDYAKGCFRGQEQTFWLIELLGDDTLIDLNSHHPEFSAWAWCNPEDIASRVAPLRLEGYKAPVAEFLEFVKAEKG